MDGSSELERRLIAEAPGLHIKEDDNGRTVIRGYAAVYNSDSEDLGGFIERIAPGAFDSVLSQNPDVFGRYNHERLLARTSSGTMKLELDDRGLRYTIYPKHADADVVQSIERGDIRGSSFAFRTKGDGERWYKDPDGRTIREIRRFDFLGDAGPVDNPAYRATEAFVSKRALDMAVRAAAGELSTGDFVSWDSSGGQARGRITKVVKDGEIDVPDSSFAIKGTEDDPAALIRLYRESDEGWEASDRLVGHKFSTLTKIEPLEQGDDRAADVVEETREVNLRPTAGMAAAAKTGLRLHEEGKSGDGLKPETVARGRKIAARESLSDDHVREMNAWFARHESASKSPGWNTPGDEKPGWVAWQLWGGNAARAWSGRKVREMEGERDLPEVNEEADFDEPTIKVIVTADVTDFSGKIAGLKASLLRTHLHGK
jgi:uncharacterized protein